MSRTSSARPPGVVSGEPNITPIFSRSWLMKMAMVSDLLRLAVSLRSAWLMSRACRPTCAIAHLALDLGPRRERGHRVDDDDVERARADEHVGDLEGLLAGVGLARSSSSSTSTPMARGVHRDPWRARRRCTRRCRRCAAPRRRRAWPASTCRTTRGRRPRRRGLSGDRRRRARDQVPMRRWGWPRCSSSPSPPSA